MELTGNIH